MKKKFLWIFAFCTLAFFSSCSFFNFMPPWVEKMVEEGVLDNYKDKDITNTSPPYLMVFVPESNDILDRQHFLYGRVYPAGNGVGAVRVSPDGYNYYDAELYGSSWVYAGYAEMWENFSYHIYAEDYNGNQSPEIIIPVQIGEAPWIEIHSPNYGDTFMAGEAIQVSGTAGTNYTHGISYIGYKTGDSEWDDEPFTSENWDRIFGFTDPGVYDIIVRAVGGNGAVGYNITSVNIVSSPDDMLWINFVPGSDGAIYNAGEPIYFAGNYGLSQGDEVYSIEVYINDTYLGQAGYDPYYKTWWFDGEPIPNAGDYEVTVKISTSSSWKSASITIYVEEEKYIYPTITYPYDLDVFTVGEAINFQGSVNNPESYFIDRVMLYTNDFFWADAEYNSGTGDWHLNKAFTQSGDYSIQVVVSSGGQYFYGNKITLTIEDNITGYIITDAYTSQIDQYNNPIIFDNKLFFLAYADGGGGSAKIKSLDDSGYLEQNYSGQGYEYDFASPIVYNNNLYFSGWAAAEESVYYLPQGTTALAKPNIGGTTYQSGFSNPIEFNDNLFFEGVNNDYINSPFYLDTGNNINETPVFVDYESNFMNPIVLGNNLYFMGKDIAGYNRVFYIQGNQIQQPTDDGNYSHNFDNPIVYNNAIYFEGMDNSMGYAMFRIDPSGEITKIDGAPGFSYPIVDDYNDVLYFRAHDGTEYRLYKYDGGISSIGGGADYDWGFDSPILYNGKIYFVANSTFGTYKIYEFDNGSISTVPAGSSGYKQKFENPFVFDNKLFFLGEDDTYNERIYYYDGSEIRLVEIDLDLYFPYEHGFFNAIEFNENLYFGANSGQILYKISKQN